MNIAIKIPRKPLLLPLFSSITSSSSSLRVACKKPCSSGAAKKKPSSTSSSSSSISLSSYLIKNLSFSQAEADSISSKYHLPFTSTSNPDAVVSFLRSEAHLSPSQLRRFLRVRPTLLSSKVSSTLLPKLQLFKSLLPPGSPPQDLAFLISACAASFGYSSTHRLAPALTLLRSLLHHDDQKVVSALRNYPRLLTNDPTKVLSRNADLLRDRGVTDPDRLAHLIYKSPFVLFISPSRLESAFAVAEREFGFDVSSPKSFNDFINVVSLASLLTEDGFMKKVEILRKFMYTNEELLVLFRNSPTFMKLKEDYMAKKLEFFRDEVGMGPKEMLYNVWILMLSLETRLLPRHKLVQGLKEMGLVSGELVLRKVFIMTHEKFDKEFVDKFKDGRGSDLVQTYLNTLEAKKKVASPE